MPFSFSFILLFSLPFFLTSFPKTSLVPPLSPPWAPQPVFCVSPTYISHLFILSSLWACLTDVLPSLVPNWPVCWIHQLLRQREAFHGYLMQILFLEPQLFCSAKLFQLCVITKQSWIKDLRSPCLLMHTGELRDHSSSWERLIQRQTLLQGVRDGRGT